MPPGPPRRASPCTGRGPRTPRRSGASPCHRRGRGSRCPSRPARRDARRIPRATAAGLTRHPPRSPDRRESPARLPGRRRERVERAAAVRGDPERADVDRAVRHLGRNVDVALGRRLEQSRPEELPGGRRERERRGVGCAVDRPRSTTTPFGPAVSSKNRWSQRTAPVFRSSAKTLLSMSWTYTTPCATTGVAVNTPEAPAGAPKRKRHATRSVCTLARSMPLVRSARVEDRSRFASGQSPPPAADATPDVPMTSASAASSGRWRRQNLCSGCVFSILVRTPRPVG